MRTLDLDGVRTLLEYERGHGNRLPVVTVPQDRTAQLEQGARPRPTPPSRAERAGAAAHIELMIDRIVGPSSTMKSTGRMQTISGKITLTGICMAFSSAR